MGGVPALSVCVALAITAFAASSASSANIARLVVSWLLIVTSLRLMRLHPRGHIDISWSDLFAAFRYAWQDLLLPRMFTAGSRLLTEASILRLWTSRGDGFACLSVRAGIDLTLEALELPRGSEVLFAPGINIPAVVKLVEARGLRARGLDPRSSAELLPPVDELQSQVSEHTRVLVITHLFGAVFDSTPLIQEAQRLGLFVIEDCAQGFVGAVGSGGSSSSTSDLASGFRGHAEADAAFVSFGLIKTHTCLGGCVGHVRDAKLRSRMADIQRRWPQRSTLQFLSVVLKAVAFKILGDPHLWGLAAAISGFLGLDFDNIVVAMSRGFPGGESFKKQPSLPLLYLLERRLRNQKPASLPGAQATQTCLSARRRVGARLVARLVQASVEVPAHGVAGATWWLAPMVDEDPKHIAHGLRAKGFDATSTSSQLAAVASIASGANVKNASSSLCQQIMRNILYLPVTPQLPLHAADALASAIVDLHKEREAGSVRAVSSLSPAARHGLRLLFVAFSLLCCPEFLIWLLPSTKILLCACVASTMAISLAIAAGRFFTRAPGLKVSRDMLRALSPAARKEGVEFCRCRTRLDARVDGAILITGATGFVGGGTLFAVLARAEELGVKRIVLLVRKKAGVSVSSRLSELRKNPAFDEVRSAFDSLVVALEGDVSQKDFGWKEGTMLEWPYEEPLKAVIHCAGDVRFDQPLRQAALSLTSASLQTAQLAARWGAKRFVFVSTAFVHGVPSAGNCLQERLVELRDFDPMELYRDAITDGRWAEKAMRELGFPNTYTFAKAVTEHLVLRVCAAEGVQAHIVRPSIVGPAWAAPYAGWCGDKPSTIVGGAVLLAKRGVRVFRSSSHSCPIVPVDLVADVIVRTVAAPSRTILHAAIDASEAYQAPSFRVLMERLFQVLALRDDLPLPESGFLLRALHWADNETIFWCLHAVFNVAPWTIASSFCANMARLWRLVFLNAKHWEARHKSASTLRKLSSLPAQYMPFTCPASPWLFQSSLRLPKDWDSMEYSCLVYRGAVAFAKSDLKSGPHRGFASTFREVRVATPRAACCDALIAFSTAGQPLYMCLAGFLVRLALGWVNMRITIDVASVESATSMADPLVLCPHHRSVLDFVILGAACFQLSPLLPTLQVPHVAADAEFAGLPVLGPILAALGAFFVRRGGGAVQPDPALRAEVSRVFRKGRPIEVFLEGQRSRGRRQLRLRSGLLRALRDVAHRRVALVPVGLSYELLPEDRTFYDELNGNPRPPLSTLALVNWVLGAVRGELPPLGDAHVQLGTAQTLDASSELLEVVAEVQDQLVALTSITALHAVALAEVTDLPCDGVVQAFRSAGLDVRQSRIANKGARRQLSDAERWPLAIQAATVLRHKLPQNWARWFVEPILEGCSQAVVEEACAHEEQSAAAACAAGDQHLLDVDTVFAAFTQRLKAAEDAAFAAAVNLRENGAAKVTEEHLLQQLLQPCGTHAVPAALARGAACIVATEMMRAATSTDFVTSTMVAGPPVRQLPAVVPLWPTELPAEQSKQRSNEEALDRWGYKDTRFVAQWVDGRPTVKSTSNRYASIGGRSMPKLWSMFQQELGISMNVRNTLPEKNLPRLPDPAPGLTQTLAAAVPAERINTSVDARLRAGTGHGLQDVWRLRTREVGRMPDAVVRPENEDEVIALLKAAGGGGSSGCPPGEAVPFAIIPVGGRTNVTSATAVPDHAVDPRPFVALDMRGLAAVRWVNAEDGVAMVEAGITGKALQDELRKKGVNMGMEPDSMEFSTLGGWIATKASGMKRARYGNIENMIVEVRVATPSGIHWQHHDNASGRNGDAKTAFGRVSANVSLPGLVLGSEGCLAVVIAATVRVFPLPERVEYDSVIFPDWEHGAGFMRSVARLPAALRPASCRLMDSQQLRLAQAIRDDPAKGSLRKAVQQLALRVSGVRLEEAAATTLVFEGSSEEVTMQKRVLRPLVRQAGGTWGGASSGEAGYALTFAIAYLRDFGLDYHILSESLETMAPWSKIAQVWPAVVSAVVAEHKTLRLPGRPFLSCRMTQIYDEGGVLYMYIAVCTTGLLPDRALEAFERLEHAAREAAMAAGACISHHHGIGKLRAKLLPTTQAPALSKAIEGLKEAFDPGNVLGAGNGAWAAMASKTTSDEQAADVAKVCTVSS